MSKITLPEAIKDKYRVLSDKPRHHIPRMSVNVDLRTIDAETAQQVSLLHPELLERVPVKEVKAEVKAPEVKPPAETK
jgi:hypothetical protein